MRLLLLFIASILCSNLNAQKCKGIKKAKVVLRRQIIAFSNGSLPQKKKISDHSCFNKKSNKKFKAFYKILKAYHLCNSSDSNLETITSLYKEANKIMDNIPPPLINFNTRPRIGFLKAKESVEECISNKFKESSKDETSQQIKEFGKGLKPLLPEGCPLPDIISKPSNENLDQVFYLDVYMCEDNLTFGDRLHLGQIGLPLMYDTFAVFMNNEIINDYISRRSSSRTEALSNIHITIEGHTDKVIAQQLNYSPKSFSVPKGIEYTYEEYNRTIKIKEQKKTLKQDLVDKLYGNEQLGLVRAHVAKKIIAARNITSNPIILKSIHHTKQKGKEFRKAKIIIEIDSFYINTQLDIIYKLADKIEDSGNIVDIRFRNSNKLPNTLSFIKDTITIDKKNYTIEFDFKHSSPGKLLSTIILKQNKRKVYNYTIKLTNQDGKLLRNCQASRGMDCQLNLSRKDIKDCLVKYTIYVNGTKEDSSIYLCNQ
ncbi:hypothetical protein [Aureispira anguillae]|uniref:Uncharacterized protein n=1 Tax=Aureispira anguillae TaxID=2864201 RepID=A0A916DTJ8_9BACT|nr:hypothetical protein [Aureispira anguillae]BDS11847.1 hypothetical protein AsAng_0025610 [Aureispira anguillae]